MPPTRNEVLQAMEKGWQEFRHELRDLDYSLDWKNRPDDPSAWSPRDILAHVIGTAELNLERTLRRILAEETPTVELEGGNPYRTAETRAMQLPQLLARLDAAYERLCQLVNSSTDAQLQRKARISGRDGTSSAERNLLEIAHRVFTNHWPEHARQLHEIREELGVAEL